mmetsp:Transcript_8496/g.18706  ORF Transcript_8496/g.18706 Transcript_8496/m.18706 type:complete len:211 (-) Transcript_8496:198-830(-)
MSIYVVPVEAGKSRALFYWAGATVWWMPTWLIHSWSNRFFNTDTWLHNAERVARFDPSVHAQNRKQNGHDEHVGQGYVYGSRSDLSVVSFRKWWSTFGFKNAPKNTFGPASADDLPPSELTRFQQINPWENHSKHCSSCRDALAIMKKGKRRSILFAALSTILFRNRPVVASVSVILSLLTNRLFAWCASAVEGNPFASNVDDRSASHVD